MINRISIDLAQAREVLNKWLNESVLRDPMTVDDLTFDRGQVVLTLGPIAPAQPAQPAQPAAAPASTPSTPSTASTLPAPRPTPQAAAQAAAAMTRIPTDAAGDDVLLPRARELWAAGYNKGAIKDRLHIGTMRLNAIFARLAELDAQHISTAPTTISTSGNGNGHDGGSDGSHPFGLPTDETPEPVHPAPVAPVLPAAAADVDDDRPSARLRIGDGELWCSSCGETVGPAETVCPRCGGKRFSDPFCIGLREQLIVAK